MAKENRSVRISGRIKPSLNRKVERRLKALRNWSMSDYIEEALMRLVEEDPHETQKA